jgi:membrane-bound ClpP family serine protease
MSWLIITPLILWVGWKAYAGAKATGTWSNKVFFGVLLGIAMLVALIMIPIFLIPPATMQAHVGIAVIAILAVITAGVFVITIYANRWWKSVLLKRSGQNPSNPSGPA